jgi:hypothetical protein
VMAFSAWIVFNLVAHLYWPLIGIHIGASS